MTTPVKAFSYDSVLQLNASSRLRARMRSIEAMMSGRRFLAVTLNHRLFSLTEKNVIKGTIEAHNLDHLMFSMRPSSVGLVSGISGGIERFADLSEVVFVLQVMARYHISEGIVDSAYLDADASRPIVVGAVETLLSDFVREVSDCVGSVRDAKKQFPWLHSLQSLFPLIRDQKLTPLRSIPVYAGHDLPTYDDQQISSIEKDLFWVGFDPAFKDVPFDKAYPRTRWTEHAQRAAVGEGLFEDKIRYCTRCCLPETMEGIAFDEFGVCVPCRSSEMKMHIDWNERRAALDALVDSYRSSDYYDCMLPMSGGKDSMYQAHVLHSVLGVTALAVTHGQNWASTVGRFNLENCLQQFDLDHLVFNMNRSVISRVARKSLMAIGDACWHCHIGAGAFPVQTALAWNIGLMCLGESTAEADGRGSYENKAEASLYYFLEVSAKVRADEMVDEVTHAAALSPWNYPSLAQLLGSGIRYMHLGDYVFWDEERQVEFVKRRYGWMESRVENAYKGFKSVECVMAGVHDYANFIKRGIGRATIQASTDVRRGLLTREEGFELAKTFDSQRPHALDFYLALTGLSEEEFERTLQDVRSLSAYAKKLGDA